MIGIDKTKILMLKLHINRKSVARAGKVIGYIPNGVFREIIKFLY
jgi:hypothetical protein